MATITGVTFKEGGKVYYFAPGEETYEKGKGVIVETARGVEYAYVVIPRAEVGEDKIVSPLKPVIRAATPRDDETHRRNIERKGEAMQIVRERIAKFNLDMKLIDCEFTFEGSKAVFYYSAPQRVDFRELVKDLSSIFKMRIELRQVGIRDEIKMYGGIAPCGRECCCASCMPEFNKVSIKMAKNQGLSLNQSKISGLCGRLMCCLAYENDYYSEVCKLMPKIGSIVATPDGDGMVVNVNMLKMQVRVKIEDKEKDLFTYKDFSLEELKSGAPKREDGPDERAVAPEPAAPVAKQENTEKSAKKERTDKNNKNFKPNKNEKSDKNAQRDKTPVKAAANNSVKENVGASAQDRPQNKPKRPHRRNNRGGQKREKSEEK